MRETTVSIGGQGEALASRYLERRGYSIVERNWSCAFGEIDIIARRDATLIFAEVKTRRANSTDDILSGITRQKHERLLRAASQYLHDHGLEEALWRIDAIAVAIPRYRPPQIKHIQDVFDW